MAIILSKTNIPANTLLVAGPIIALAAITFFVTFTPKKREHANNIEQANQTDHSLGNIIPEDTPRNFLLFGLYLVVGFLATSWIVISSLSQPDGILQIWDNAFHYGQIRSFLESGSWSPLYCSRYLADGAGLFDPYPSSGYYPAAWHLLSVMQCSGIGVSPTLAANATTTCFTAFVLPSGMFLIMYYIFNGRTEPMIFGAISCVSFAAFPWVFFYAWVITPNLISMCLVPALIWLFMILFSAGVDRNHRIIVAYCLLIGLICMVFTQPNCVFTAAVFLAPFICYRIWTTVSERFANHPKRILYASLACAGWIVFVAFVWVGCTKLPYISKIVEYEWGTFTTWGRAVQGVLTLSFIEWEEQLVLAALVIIGAIYTVFRRKYFWVTAAYIFSAIICAFAEAGGETLLKHLLSGFWYTDPYRVAGFVALFGIPLATLGMYAVYRVCMHAIKRIARKDFTQAGNRAILCTTLLLFVLGIFTLPTTQHVGQQAIRDNEPLNKSVFEDARERINLLTSLDPDHWQIQYDYVKRDFVRQAMELIPDNTPIFNQPYDGSLWSYGMDGFCIVNRYIGFYGLDWETEENTTMRLAMDEYAKNPKVQKAIETTGVQYVLRLDYRQLNNDFNPNRPYYKQDWMGINAITDETPGFEAVLASDNMRLYRIVPLDELNVSTASASA